jgi:hypothetical protein
MIINPIFEFRDTQGIADALGLGAIERRKPSLLSRSRS